MKGFFSYDGYLIRILTKITYVVAVKLPWTIALWFYPCCTDAGISVYGTVRLCGNICPDVQPI